ncbi:MAG: hypothetical protein HY668_00020 [Chloroflexi bacterium]|nr:hypothetical protein [Chloroflexota bacterium]
MNKTLRTVLALVLALSILTLSGTAVLATDRLVDQRAELELMPKVEGVTGDAELRLRIDEDGMLELFRIKVEADGLVAGGTYSLFLGKHLIATDVADEGGGISFDEELDMFHKDTLVGLKIKVIYGTTIMEPVVLFGKVMETDLVESVIED